LQTSELTKEQRKKVEPQADGQSKVKVIIQDLP